MINKEDGSFYTPELFADFANNIIEKVFGENWYDEYYVWDPAWGIGNLTKNKKYKNLYASTLHQEDIDNSDANPEAYKFQFDFLNDPIKSLFGVHVPESLYDALLNDKPIIFFMNPPYAAPNDMEDGVKNVAIDTFVKDHMTDLKYARQNLFSQFLFRILMIKTEFNLTNCHICLFSTPVFISGSGYEKFRVKFLKHFNYVDGYLFNASYFDECSKRWGISFSVWKCGECENKNDFPHNIIDVKNGKIETIGVKNIYNIDGLNSFRNFCKDSIKGKKTYPTITLKTPIVVGDKDGSFMTTDAIGFYVNAGNNVYKSLQQCYILSSSPNNVLSGFSITKDNFLPVCANFATRKVITNNWINNKDEFIAPNINDTNKDLWTEFISDSVIYSMFNSSSYQSGLFKVMWKEYEYNINNEFFFMSKKEMMQLADEHEATDMLSTIFGQQERYAYELIETLIGNKMSDQAKLVLGYAKKLVIETFKHRKEFNDKCPEYQVMVWDAGYYQLKPLWKLYDPDGLKEFRRLYKDLSKKLKKQVYELGIVK